MKRILGVILALAGMLTTGHAAAQSNYPGKPVRIVVGFPPGSPVDIIARLLGKQLAEVWRQPVVIDNVSGAGGNIGADRVAKAAPEGYTLGLLGNAQLVIGPSLYKLAYDPVNDFAPVSQVAMSPYMLVVHNAVPATSVKELVALSKAQPGELTFASGGGLTLLAAELLKSAAGVDIRHIPYKGVVAAMPDLLGRRVTMMFSSITDSSAVREGKLRALAVTSLRRSAAAPELPTIDESGYRGFEVTNWFGLVAPAATPAMIIRTLHVDTVKVLALADVRAKFADLGVEGIGSSPDELAAVIKSEIPKWAKVIKEAGIKPD